MSLIQPYQFAALSLEQIQKELAAVNRSIFHFHRQVALAPSGPLLTGKSVDYLQKIAGMSSPEIESFANAIPFCIMEPRLRASDIDKMRDMTPEGASAYAMTIMATRLSRGA